MRYQADLAETKSFLFTILKNQADERALHWLKQQEEKLSEEVSPRKFNLAFSSSSRYFKKDPVQLSESSLVEADNIRKGFRPDVWDLLQVARTYVLLLFPASDKEAWFQNLQMFYETADMHEQGVLYAALPLLPYPEALAKRAAEGIRTNITSVFDAIALHNPYPAEFLDQEAWNQMVLKAVFLQRPLFRIYGADERANEELANMLIDFAHERWAAGRQVMPELWRFVGPFLNENKISDIKKVVEEGEELEKEAALLACSRSPLPEANQLLDQYPEIRKRIQEGTLSWKSFGKREALEK